MPQTSPRMEAIAADPTSFEWLLLETSTRFVDLDPSDVDLEVEAAQRQVCQFLDLDICVLWQKDLEEPHVLDISHVYRRLEGPPIPDRMNARDVNPWALNELLAGRTIALATLSDAPPEAERDRETWTHFGIKSVLAFPILGDPDEVVSVVSFHTVRRERHWDQETVTRLQLVAQILGSAINRKRSHAALRESEERFNLAADAAHVGMWALDVNQGRFWANTRGRELFAFALDQEVTLPLFLERVHPDHRKTVAAVVEQAVKDGNPLEAEYRIVLPDGHIRWILSRGRLISRGSGEASRLLGVSMDITERREAQELQSQQLRFETLLSDLTAHFVASGAENVDGGIESALGRVADFFGCERCGLIGVKPDPLQAQLQYAWYGEGVAEANPELQVDLAGHFPWTLERLVRHKEPFGFSTLDELPPEADKASWTKEGVASCLITPLALDDVVRYLFVIQSMSRHCSFPQEVVSRLGLLGTVFLNALERKRSDNALRRSYAEVKELQQQLQSDNTYLLEKFRLRHGSGRIVGESPALLKILATVEHVAPTHTTVLIEGETGTGKELVAQRIHELSARAERPMVVVNCAALPSTLVESELFGREKGAYTGAVSREAGRFEMADGSTLLLDEVAELPMELQGKLLRVLETGEFQRVGSSRTLHSNARILAATNRHLKAEVASGGFRSDLYYRLAVLPIRVPPLRDRPEDIPLLVWSIVEELGTIMNRSIEKVPHEDIERLQRYTWPGNVRELRNVVERAMILSAGPCLTISLPEGKSDTGGALMSLRDAQKQHIERALQRTRGRISGPGGAAELLDLKPTTLRSRMLSLGLDPRRARDDFS